MLVANATTDHTRRRVTTCQESRDFDAMQHTLTVKKRACPQILNHFKFTSIHLQFSVHYNVNLFSKEASDKLMLI